jgi:predicted Rossmann fold nucleotide-binding protein DprA/Smf involved in DNA uptake
MLIKRRNSFMTMIDDARQAISRAQEIVESNQAQINVWQGKLEELEFVIHALVEPQHAPRTAKRSPEGKAQDRVIELLETKGPRTSQDMAEYLGLPKGTVSSVLTQLKQAGRANNDAEGKWSTVGIATI